MDDRTWRIAVTLFIAAIVVAVVIVTTIAVVVVVWQYVSNELPEPYRDPEPPATNA